MSDTLAEQLVCSKEKRPCQLRCCTRNGSGLPLPFREISRISGCHRTNCCRLYFKAKLLNSNIHLQGSRQGSHREPAAHLGDAESQHVAAPAAVALVPPCNSAAQLTYPSHNPEAAPGRFQGRVAQWQNRNINQTSRLPLWSSCPSPLVPLFICTNSILYMTYIFILSHSYGAKTTQATGV